MGDRKIYPVIFILLATFHHTFANFRGAQVTWKPIDNKGKIEITYRVGWRRGAKLHNLCITKPTNENTGSSFIYFRFRDGQTLPIRKATYYCNADVSKRSDWMVGQNTFQYQLPPELKNFEVGFSGCCWKGITGINRSKAQWMVWTRVDVTKQHYNKDGIQVINSSPITTFQPFVYAIVGCHYKFKIPVFDADDDIVKCRFAKYFNECADGCTNLPNASLDRERCILHFKAPSVTGRYVVSLKVEDFNEAESTQPKSSVGLQFVVMVSKNRFSQSCDVKPTFVEKKDGGFGTPKCFRGEVGVPVELEMMARSEHGSDTVVEILTSSPMLSNATSHVVLDKESGKKYPKKILRWLPTRKGFHFVCFVALTKYGRASSKFCQLIMIGDLGLNRNRIMEIIPEPGSIVPINIHQIIIKFRRTIKLYSVDEIDALIYDVNQKAVAKVIKHRDVTILNSTILVINLRDFVRDYVKKYRLVAQRLVTSDPEDFCVSQPRIQYADFVMASERDPVEVKCEKNRFTVSINKSFFAPYQMIKAHLDQSECTARLGSGHMTISTNYSACWTRVVANTTHVTYLNTFHYAIKIPSFRYNDEIVKKRPIICTVERSFNHTDEEGRNSLVKKDAAAVYLLPHSPIGRILVTFEMYVDEDFIHKYQPYEFPLKLKEQRYLYFQLVLNTTHESINIVLDSCYTKTESIMGQWNGSRKYYFVRNRCGDANSFQMLNQTTNQVLRFSLNPAYIEHFSKDIGLFFHCDVSICRKCYFACQDVNIPNVRRIKRSFDVRAEDNEISFGIGAGQIKQV